MDTFFEPRNAFSVKHNSAEYDSAEYDNAEHDSAVMNLSNRGLTEIPVDVRKRSMEIERLDLTENPLERLPEWIGELSRLQELRVARCHLASLPTEIAQLTSLKVFDLSNNPLRTLPEPMRHLTGLQTLGLNGCNLTELPHWIDETQALTHFTSLNVLDLSNNPLMTLPEPMRYLTRLQFLALNGCELEELPDWIGEMQALTHLDLGQNPLRALPRQITHLPELTELAISGAPDLPHYLRDSAPGETRSALLRYHRETFQQNLRGLNVIVLGLAADVIPSRIRDAARLAGQALAEAGASLITGDYLGVDHEVANAYIARVNELTKGLTEDEQKTRRVTILSDPPAVNSNIRQSVAAVETLLKNVAFGQRRSVNSKMAQEEWSQDAQMMLCIGNGPGAEQFANRAGIKQRLSVLMLEWADLAAAAEHLSMDDITEADVTDIASESPWAETPNAKSV